VAGIINDSETVDFVRQKKGRKIPYVGLHGRICSGSAGLLKGRRATTHWAYTDLLPPVGAAHEKARIVKVAVGDPGTTQRDKDVNYWATHK
jgi:cyclohexyl-isocyanide hydratase